MRRCKMDYEKKLIDMGYSRFYEKIFYRRLKNGNMLVFEFYDDWELAECYVNTGTVKIKTQEAIDDYQIALNDLNKDLRELENE